MTMTEDANTPLTADETSTAGPAGPRPDASDQRSNDLPPMSGEIQIEAPPEDHPVWSEPVTVGVVRLGTVSVPEPLNQKALDSTPHASLAVLALNHRLNLAGNAINHLQGVIEQMRQRIENLEDDIYEDEPEPEPAPPPAPPPAPRDRKRRKLRR
jgi:hypothetical protein